MAKSSFHSVLESLAHFCADPIAKIEGCLGVCANPAIGGTGSRSATYAQAIIAGFSIIWLEKPSDRRHAYYLQCLSAGCLAIIGMLYGGYLSMKSVSAFHALLIAYLAFGSASCGAVAFYMLCFTTLPELGVFILSYAAFISAITYLTVASMNSSQFGSQPPCNSHLVSSPFRIPGGALLFALAAGPWVFAIVGIVLWKVREVCARASAASIVASEEYEMSQIEARWTGPDAEVASRVVACWRNLTTSRPRQRRFLPNYRVSFFQRCVWTLILGGYYATWIYLTEKFIAAQKLPIIGESERRFTQSQVQAVAFAIIQAMFPLRAFTLSIAQWMRRNKSRRASTASTGSQGGHSGPPSPTVSTDARAVQQTGRRSAASTNPSRRTTVPRAAGRTPDRSAIPLPLHLSPTRA